MTGLPRADVVSYRFGELQRREAAAHEEAEELRGRIA
jgi:hypothetical protein